MEKKKLYLFLFYALCVHSFLVWLCPWGINRAAAAAISKRHADGSLPLEDQIIELEDQSGRQVKLGTETDQRYGKYLEFAFSTFSDRTHLCLSLGFKNL